MEKDLENGLSRSCLSHPQRRESRVGGRAKEAQSRFSPHTLNRLKFQEPHKSLSLEESLENVVCWHFCYFLLSLLW